MLGIGTKRLAQGASLVQSIKLVGGLAIVIGLLALLAYAETVWLKDLPRDSVTRVTLVAAPRSATEITDGSSGASLPVDWSQRLLQEVSKAELARDVIAALDLHDGATGRMLSPEQLMDSLHQGGQCIMISYGQGQAVPGLLLFAAVRGSSTTEVQSVAQEWTRQFRQKADASFPGLIIQPMDALGVPYQICGSS